MSLSYKLSDNHNLYASYSTGYQSGGFNYNGAGDSDSFIYSPEFSREIELGWKGRFINERLNLTAAFFDISTTDKQVVDLQIGGIQSISNAAKTSSYGFEFSVNWKVSELFTTYANK